MPRRMNHRTTTEALRAVIEKPRMRGTGWFGKGPKYQVRPKLVAEVFGDGKVLLILTPCVTSVPNYYVVRIDSTWSLKGSRWNSDHDAPIRDHLDEIYDAIGDEFGWAPDEGDEDYDDEDRGKHWPALDLEIGSSWGIDEWPFYPEKKKLARCG